MEQKTKRGYLGHIKLPLLEDKVEFPHEVKGEPFNVPFHASSRADTQNGRGIISLTELGVSEAFRLNPEPRDLWVCRKTGGPSFEERPVVEAARLSIEGEMLSYLVLDEGPDGFRLVCVGCAERTFYITFTANGRSARFWTDAPSYHGRHAIRELLQMNLLNGPRPYERTANLVPGFFKRALGAVYDRRSVLNLKTATLKGRKEGEEFGARIYLTPGNFKATIISVQGWCFDFDLDYYPKWQQILVERYQERKERRINMVNKANKELQEA
jgi:hypothetical protein